VPRDAKQHALRGPSRVPRRGGAPWLVAVAWSSAVAFAVAGATYAPAVVATPHAGGTTEPLAAEFALLAVYVSLATVGAVLATRRATNPIGWLFLASAWLFAAAELAHGYAHHAVLVGATDTALARWAALLGVVLFLPPFILVTMYLPLVFPDGRLLSPRWRYVVALLVVAVTCLTVVEVLSAGSLPSFPEIDNPVGWVGAEAALTRITTLIDPLFLPIVVAVAASVVLRFRRATPVERQQFKWVALPAGVLLVFLPLNEYLLRDAGGTFRVVGTALFFLGFAGLPVGVGVAVLRYRLFEIDRIVSRTITYGLLTLTLAGAYTVAVVVIGAGLRVLTGGRSSDLAVAASTLAVVGLFRPTRRRIMAAVDRRFNRSRYDARQTAERFALRLRDEIDLEALLRELHQIANVTVEPVSSSIWLPGSEPTGEGRAPSGRPVAGRQGIGPHRTVQVAGRQGIEP
jgi:hypothetical protein